MRTAFSVQNQLYDLLAMCVLQEMVSVIEAIEARVHLASPLSAPGFREGLVGASPDKMHTLLPLEQCAVVKGLGRAVSVVVAIQGDR